MRHAVGLSPSAQAVGLLGRLLLSFAAAAVGGFAGATGAFPPPVTNP